MLGVCGAKADGTYLLSQREKLWEDERRPAVSDTLLC